MSDDATDGQKGGWRVWVDTGGTFTDCLAADPRGRTHRFKVLSSSCLRGTLLGIDSPTEIAVTLTQSLVAGFALGQQFRLLGQSSEPIEIIGHDSPSQLRLAKPLPGGTPHVPISRNNSSALVVSRALPHAEMASSAGLAPTAGSMAAAVAGEGSAARGSAAT
mgnify:CR=1 FL=1